MCVKGTGWWLVDGTDPGKTRLPPGGPPLSAQADGPGWEPPVTSRTALIFCCLAHAFTHAVELSFPVLLLFLQKDFDQGGYAVLALIYAGSLLLFGLGGIPFGIMTDRWGGYAVILVGIGLSLVGAGLAIVAGEVDSLALFAVALLMMGLGISTYHPAGLWVLAEAFPRGKGRSHAMGLHGFGGSFGQFLSPILSGVGAALLGWQWVYGGLMVFGVLLGLVGLPLWHSWRTGTKSTRSLSQKQPSVDEHSKKEGSTYLGALKDLWSYSIAVVVALTISRGLFFRGTSAFIPALARDNWGLSAESGGLMLSLMLVAGSMGHLMGGWAHGRYGPRKPLAAFAGLSLLALVLLLWPGQPTVVGLELAGLVLELPLGLGFVGMLLFGFAFFSGQPVVNAHIADITPDPIRGLFFGLTFATRFGLASVATGWVGWAADIWSLEVALAMMALPIIVAIINALMLKGGVECAPD